MSRSLDSSYDFSALNTVGADTSQKFSFPEDTEFMRLNLEAPPQLPQDHYLVGDGMHTQVEWLINESQIQEKLVFPDSKQAGDKKPDRRMCGRPRKPQVDQKVILPFKDLKKMIYNQYDAEKAKRVSRNCKLILDTNVRMCLSAIVNFGENFKLKCKQKLTSLTIVCDRNLPSQYAVQKIRRYLRYIGAQEAADSALAARATKRLLRLAAFIGKDTTRYFADILGLVLCTVLACIVRGEDLTPEYAVQSVQRAITNSKNAYTRAVLDAVRDCNNAAGVMRVRRDNFDKNSNVNVLKEFVHVFTHSAFTFAMRQKSLIETDYWGEW